MTKDKMLDYIVAQLPPELTPSGLIFVAAEFLSAVVFNIP